MTKKQSNSKAYLTFEPGCSKWGLPIPIREYRFHPTRRWRFDFCWLDQQVALEVEGGAFHGPGHRSVGKFLRDMEKYNAAQELHWRVFRCTPADIVSGKVFSLLKRVLG